MASRGWAVLGLLLVIGGGTAMVAETVFGVTSGWEEPTLDTAGLVFLANGMGLLGGVTDKRRAKIVAFVAGFGGIAIILLDGFVRSDSRALFYAGTAIAVATGVGLFGMVLNTNQKQNTSVP